MQSLFFLSVILLIGIVLTVITIMRMRSGQLSLPRWGKVMLSIAMLFMLAITLLGMLPPIEVDVDNPFINEETHIVTPVDPESSEVKIPD